MSGRARILAALHAVVCVGTLANYSPVDSACPVLERITPWVSLAQASEPQKPAPHLVLKQPARDMVFLPKLEFEQGSGMEDRLFALALCMREPLSHRCNQALGENEAPAHAVTVSAFWLDRSEVRVRDYERCSSQLRCPPLLRQNGNARFFEPDFPVTFVPWTAARAYCEFRGARLPTEAEFERAARGATGRRFPWGQNYHPRVANHGRLGIDPLDERDGFAELAPVVSFATGNTPEGIADLAGNVAEWVFDLYEDHYPEEHLVDPKGPALNQSGHRVVRGGSFLSPPHALRSAARSSLDPAEAVANVGFRCARSAY